MPNWGLLGAIALPNIGGWGVALTTADQIKGPNGKDWYNSIKRPSWNPPDWVFGSTWTALYSSIGYASYMVYKDCGGFTGTVQKLSEFRSMPHTFLCQYVYFNIMGIFSDKAMVPLALYGGQLIINWTWTPVFFKMHKIGLALIHLLALDVAAMACAISFYNVNPNTMFFMTPYLCWLSFATCLNHTLWDLNKDDKKK